MTHLDTYLDYAAATPTDERVIAAMLPYFAEKFYNPSSLYAPAVKVRRDIEAARQKIAQNIGAKPTNIIFTAGATESINLAMTSAPHGNIVTSAIEHSSVLESCRGPASQAVSVPKSGCVRPDDIAAAITSETELISVALVNNELGTVQPIRAIAEVVEQERQRRQSEGIDRAIVFHCDASQGVGQLDINVARLGVDLLTLNAAKCYGPKQMALLWHRNGVTLKPLIKGGGQENGLRSGTENTPGIIGFARALEIISESHSSEVNRLASLRDTLEREITSALPQVQVNVNTKKRLKSHLHISIPGVDAERIIYALEQRDVYVATGSACAANHGRRSHVLEAIGLSDSEADGSLRMSLGRYSSESGMHAAAHEIISAIRSELARVSR